MNGTIDRKVDVLVVGGGPAGITAAIYTARAGLNTLVVEKEAIGGNINSSPMVENIPGFERISGVEYGEKLMLQAINCGVNIDFDEIININPVDDGKTFIANTSSGVTYLARSVILAIGTKHRTLELGEEKIDRGIYYCVACDGPFAKDKDVLVVGGGNSAVTAAIDLADIAKSVTIIQNLPYLTAETTLIDKLAEKNNIIYCFDCEVKGYITKKDNGNRCATGIKVAKPADPDYQNIKNVYGITGDMIFLEIGFKADNGRFNNIIDVNKTGFITRYKYDKIRAAGDCYALYDKQVVIAAGSGATAALSIIKELREEREIVYEKS